MQEAVIVDAVRTPFGDRDGAFADVHPQDLAAEPLLALEERLGFDPERTIEDVIYGCVTPIGEQGGNIGRLAPLVAGWGDDVPGVQLNRMCGSGQQAVNFAAGAVATGAHDVLVAGGVEHMTRAPIGSDYDGVASSYFDHYDELVHQGESAERIAEEWGFGRRELDELAADSQRRWKGAWDAGRYESQITPVEVEVDGETRVVDADEHPRPESTADGLGELPLAFRDAGDGVIHAGNSSGIVDGASAVLVARREVAEERGWEPMARIVQTEVVGVDPVTMLTGPIPATEGVLEKTDLTIDDVDLFEVNEAFASVVAAWLEEMDVPRAELWERTNVNGGAIAHGHPLGATGAALITKLVHELDRTGKDVGLSTMCIGFGQGIATIVERI
ncbi:thiolase family protein [Halosolutus gelatinilyticus]|uniref:thiolase family protein n=1 Tax=Halosolutus gelatinilyticus TaxID=2931975 RepID=UPI001FF47D0F|nr:thiolase family protein [Halosolutus gelatinilyticus]